MVTQEVKEGRDIINIQMPSDAESHMETIYALLHSIGFADKDTPLTNFELNLISSLIEAMLPTHKQVNLNAE